MEFVEVIKPGLLTTVQDLGRPLYRTFGVSVCGAMDLLSLRLGNLLVGNEEGEAALEVTLIGPHLRFHTEGVIAITGGNLSPLLNNKSIPMWKALRVQKGDELKFGNCRDGCRAYISFAGGIDVPRVMGSKSTYIRGNYGGIEGRAIRVGDVIPIGMSLFHFDDLHGRKLRPDDIPSFKDRPVQFIVGPHTNEFTKDSFVDFLEGSYTLSNESDRMGYRTEGPQLKHINGPDIISDFMTVGTIQVPGSGQPIIHMSDCGTSGGYTKIGVIISTDISYIGQKKPGDKIRFVSVDIEEAQKKWIKQERSIEEIGLINKLLPKRRLLVN
ncbi:biotin-dependent carboxyltransferase family protein [Metabacillus litoralis]|uniref:5-oxoprolinase subunit C family protein n=1 Tax=Metabacillus litoralis TaxID=152268 RepID=UPI00203C91C1|nr:biotin-dependent carboxyltransferase family protein [Metabacillus litoralis]MCM3160764.1 biotin-dependent carboxyltransferase family protein [Metabacillus litoralis]